MNSVFLRPEMIPIVFAICLGFYFLAASSLEGARNYIRSFLVGALIVFPFASDLFSHGHGFENYALQIRLLIAAVVILLLFVRSGREMDLVRRMPTRGDWIYFFKRAAPSLMGLMSLTVMYFVVLRYLTPAFAQKLDNLRDLSNLETDSPLVFFLGVVVLTPLAEELFFRGVFLTALERFFPIQSALLISSVVFGIFHLDPTKVVMGLVFGLAFVRTRSLIYPTLLHAFNNLIPFLMMRLAVPPDAAQPSLATSLTYIGVLLFYVVVLLWATPTLFRFIKENWPRSKERALAPI